jgi:CheY-like chemotaxis protein
VDVAQLCHSLADMLRRTVDQRIVIAVEVVGRCPPALADAGQLESALLNIAINARDAMPDGGSLGFVVGASEELPAKVRHELQGSARSHDGYLSITVADSGSGMSDEVKERAFEPFFTTKQSGRGTGLGLSTVYGFVKQSHGAITIDSAPGSGTRVTLYLPQLRRVVDALQGDVIEPHTVPAGLRVLLVEDDPEVAAVARGFLQAASCQVVHATSGEQALRVLESGTAFDLMLSDIALGPGMRGTVLAEAAQRSKPQLPVLLMTGYSSQLPDSAPSGPMLQWEVLLKPFSRQQLQAAMARAMSVDR